MADSSSFLYNMPPDSIDTTAEIPTQGANGPSKNLKTVTGKLNQPRISTLDA